MAIKRTNVRLMFYLTNQGVPDRYEVYYDKWDDSIEPNDPIIASRRHENPIEVDGTMTLNQIIIATRNALR